MSIADQTLDMYNIMINYSDVFTGKGKLEPNLRVDKSVDKSIRVDKSVTLVVMHVRKIPLAIKKPLKKEIDCLVQQGILEPVNTPTD